MSPLFKYYGALATSLLWVLVGLLVGPHHSFIFVAAIFVTFGFFIYAMVGPRCPRCQTRLYGPAVALPAYGFPGRYCTECEYDLLTPERHGAAGEALSVTEHGQSRLSNSMDRLGAAFTLSLSAFLAIFYFACVLAIIFLVCRALGFWPSQI